MAQPRTLFDKIWDAHVVVGRTDGQSLLYIDRLYVADDILPDVYRSVFDRGLAMRQPGRAFGTPDHYVPTTKRHFDPTDDAERRMMVSTLADVSAKAKFSALSMNDPRQGIVHVVGPEQGLTLPGATIVCADSHTPTHGALGSFAFGIGYSEFAHVLASQCIWQRKPKTMRVTISGALPQGVYAKDVIMALIARIGVDGANGQVIEFDGSAVAAMSVEARMTICNMSIEAGAKSALVAPDDKTIAYLAGRPYAPSGEVWDRAVHAWRSLRTDDGARFDKQVALDAAQLRPMVTWGTSPQDAIGIDDLIPVASESPDGDRTAKALSYMGLVAGRGIAGTPVDRVFIGSCTNGRIEDIREVARIAANRRAVVPSIVVPGSGLVKAQAEAEGLDVILRQAGFEWREAGCSMCIAINGDIVPAGERCAATTNRNFVNRQGPGVRTHLMSPAMAAAAAVSGCIIDARSLGTA